MASAKSQISYPGKRVVRTGFYNEANATKRNPNEHYVPEVPLCLKRPVETLFCKIIPVSLQSGLNCRYFINSVATNLTKINF